MNKLEYINRKLKKENVLKDEIISNTKIALKGINQEFKDYKQEVKKVISKLQNMKKDENN